MERTHGAHSWSELAKCTAQAVHWRSTLMEHTDGVH